MNDKFGRRQKELEMAYQNLPKGTKKLIRISSGDSRLQGRNQIWNFMRQSRNTDNLTMTLNCLIVLGQVLSSYSIP